MEQRPLNESLWRRGWQDTKRGWKSVWFIVLEAVLAPLLALFVEWWWGIVAVIGGMLCIWIGATTSAPIKQRNQARAKVVELEDELKKPKLFDIEWPTTTLELPIVHREDGTWIASSAQVSPSPITIVHRGDLTTIYRVTLAPQVRFFNKDGTGWMSTNAITVKPQVLFSPAMRPPGATDFDWDVCDPSQWVLNGLPLPMAKDELLELPEMVLDVSNATMVGEHSEKGDKCILAVRLAIRTDKGSPSVPDKLIELTISNIEYAPPFFKLEEEKTNEASE